MQDVLSQWLAITAHRRCQVFIAARFCGDAAWHASSQRLVECRASDALLTVRFNGGERLIVSHPSSVRIGPSHELVVGDATEASFCWYRYGHPRSLENLCEEVFTKRDHVIVFERMGPSFPTGVTFPYEGDRFVQVLSGRRVQDKPPEPARPKPTWRDILPICSNRTPRQLGEQRLSAGRQAAMRVSTSA